jgi:hypothetical protein
MLFHHETPYGCRVPFALPSTHPRLLACFSFHFARSWPQMHVHFFRRERLSAAGTSHHWIEHQRPPTLLLVLTGADSPTP